MLLGTQEVNAKGHLEIGGCDTVDLAAQFGTPLYVMDEALIRSNCRRYMESFTAKYPSNVICFAGKSFLTRAMARIVDEEGLSLDVASLGELHVALSAGFPANRINLHGNNKLHDELVYAVRAGVGHVVLDHFGEIEMLSGILASDGASVKVLVRCTPGIDPDTHRYMSTGQADTKFGFNISDGSAIEAISTVLRTPGLEFDGIHFHVGSQLLDTECHEAAVDLAISLIQQIRDDLGAGCPILNIGGGLGVRYVAAHRPPTIEEYAERITTRLKECLDEAGLPYPTLQQEPGRSIVGEAGVTLYTAGARKSVPIVAPPGHRTYIAVDGGLSDNPRPQLYDAVYEAICANRASEPHIHPTAIAGRHCETDVLVWDAHLPSVEPGDIIAVQTTGAYNFAMASNYNRFLRPAVVFVRDGVADLVQRRETLDDLIRHDVIPDRLRPGT